MYRTNNPISDYDRYSSDQEDRLEQLPKCSYCDEPIIDEYAWYINDEWICDECLRYHHRKEVVPGWE